MGAAAAGAGPPVLYMGAAARPHILVPAAEATVVAAQGVASPRT